MRRKGQFFIISAVVVVILLMSITSMLSNKDIQDPSTHLRDINDALRVLDNINYELSELISILSDDNIYVVIDAYLINKKSLLSTRGYLMIYNINESENTIKITYDIDLIHMEQTIPILKYSRISAWDFDDGIGVVAKDKTGTNDGELINFSFTKNSGWSDNCISGNCLVFDGIDDYVDVGYMGEGVKTISFWIKANSNTEKIMEFASTQSCGDTIEGIDSITYGTILAEDGNCWLDRNLGATQVATAYNDAAAYGWYYQWGRGFDGHQITSSSTTNTLSSTNDPGHANFILLLATPPFDWRVPQNDALWQGVNGINNPCPNTFRLPTDAEWINLISAENITNSTTAYNSSLKITVPGYRQGGNNLFSAVGNSGIYWSSSVSGVNVLTSGFTASSTSSSNPNNRIQGYSVRCVMGLISGDVSIGLSAGMIETNGFIDSNISVDGVASSTMDTGWHNVVITTDSGINVSDLKIGKAINYFNGTIDNIRIYNQSLTAEQVQFLYSNSRN